MSSNNFTRRQFGLTVASTFATGGMALSDAGPVPASAGQRLPREVWVASMALAGLKANDPQEMCKKMLSRMEEVTPYQPDIICTPEVFPFSGLPGGKPHVPAVAEERTGPVLDQFAEFARRHHCYVICSTYTKEGGRFYNAAVLLDRSGRYVGEYRKINPDEGDMALGCTPGPLQPPVFETDFGTIGMQICYDANWYDNWRRLGDAGAKIVFWPSFFAGGMMLNSLAWMNKFYVVSSVLNGDPTKMVDPLGTDIVATGRAANWICAPLNLDFAVVQTMDQLHKVENMSKKYGRAFRIRILHVEALAMVESVSPEISVAQALKEFDIPTAKEMLANSTREQNARRPA
jgi:predicted amidohydrolase